MVFLNKILNNKTKMSEMQEQKNYPEWAKVPQDYDFSTRSLIIRKKLGRTQQGLYSQDRRSLGKTKT